MAGGAGGGIVRQKDQELPGQSNADSASSAQEQKLSQPESVADKEDEIETQIISVANSDSFAGRKRHTRRNFHRNAGTKRGEPVA